MILQKPVLSFKGNDFFKMANLKAISSSATLILASISNYRHYKASVEFTYPFPNVKGAAVDVWEWISYFTPHFTWHVITYRCWDWSNSMLVKGALGWGLLSQFPPFRYFPIFFRIIKTHLPYWISRLYLTGVSAAELRWHLSNMNVIQRI